MKLFPNYLQFIGKPTVFSGFLPIQWVFFDARVYQLLKVIRQHFRRSGFCCDLNESILSLFKSLDHGKVERKDRRYPH